LDLPRGFLSFTHDISLIPPFKMPRGSQKSPSKRGKQRLDRVASKPSAGNLNNSTARTHNLLAGARSFRVAGMRYPPEIAIHKELYDIESQRYLDV
jgi:hypothetical protein